VLYVGNHTNVGHHPDKISLDVLFEEQPAQKLSQEQFAVDLALTRPIGLQIECVAVG
jgi:hypothetical protein